MEGLAKKTLKVKRTVKTIIPLELSEKVNDEQLEVVKHLEGPGLVIAGAGSGKTRALTYRVAYLISRNISPSSIMLVTFTKKAAEEMVFRVKKITGGQAEKIYGGTFHSLANRILRPYAKELGYTNKFSIYDSGDQNEMMKIAKAVVLSQIHKEKTSSGEKQEKKLLPKPRQLINMNSISQNLKIPLTEIINTKFSQFIEEYSIIKRIIDVYSLKKKENNAMDFDDLLINFLTFLKSDKGASKVKNQLRHIMVDEFQDVNAIQADIIYELGKGATSLVAVGDDAQAIYSFRGADFTHMIEFKKRYPTYKEYYLKKNYRSVPEILNLSNDSIAFNKKQYKKELIAIREQSGDKPGVISCRNIYDQAETLIDLIIENRDQNIPLHEQCILFRSSVSTIAIEPELTKANIPYDIRAGIRFFEKAHIKDTLAVLALIANSKAEVQWMRALALHEKISSGSAQKVINKIISEENPLVAFCSLNIPISMKGQRITAIGIESLIKFQKFLYHLVFDKTTKKQLLDSQLSEVADLLDVIISYFEPMFKEKFEKNFSDRMRDLQELIKYSSKYKKIDKFLDEILVKNEIVGESLNRPDDIESEKPLVLSTIHQSKGLEWDIVYIVDAYEGKFPSQQSLLDENALEEERRLFYVAATRAKNTLLLLYPQIMKAYGGFDSISRRSQFIDELNEDLYDELEVEYE